MAEFNASDRTKTFEAKVTSLIAATRQLDVPKILMLRRMTMADPEARKWASEKQLNVVFSVILAKAVERTGISRLKDARDRGFVPLLPPGSENRDEDIRLLADVALQMLGPPVMSEAETTQAAFGALLARGATAAPGRTVRPVAPMQREPPPLFAAQLGPGGGDKPMSPAKAIMRQQTESTGEAEGEGESGGEHRTFTDFPTLFDETLCGYVQKTLTVFRLATPSRGIRVPFLLAPEFAGVYTDVLRRFVLPAMLSTRHMQALANSYNWSEVGGEKLIEIIQGSEVNNPILHNWDSRWAAFRTARPAKGKKAAPLRGEDNPWPLFREDATRCNYEPPSEEQIILLQDILRFEADALAKAWREMSQLYSQEFAPTGRQEQAREGAFRDGIMKWSAKLPDNVGEHLAMKAHFEFPRADATFMRKLITCFGRSDLERRRNAPFLADFVVQLVE
jgi:hypothetical protein